MVAKMAIRKISDLNMERLKKAFEQQIKDDGHNLTQFNLTEENDLIKLNFEIDGYYNHSFQWHTQSVIGKEFYDVVEEVLKAFDQDRHLKRG